MVEILITLVLGGLSLCFQFLVVNKNNIWNYLIIGILSLIILIILMLKISNYNFIENSAPILVFISPLFMVGLLAVGVNCLAYYFLKLK